MGTPPAVVAAEQRRREMVACFETQPGPADQRGVAVVRQALAEEVGHGRRVKVGREANI